MIFWALAIVVLVVVRSRFFGFQNQSLSDFAGQGPDFDPMRHLSGRIRCEGVIFGPFGRVSSRFVAEMNGVWQGNSGVVTEHFRYATGSTQHRAWRLFVAGNGALHAEADDLVGTGTGRVHGPALRMRYRLRLPAEAGGFVVSATDWTYLLDNGSMMNRSEFTKFGIKVGELQATMRPIAA